MFLWDNIGETRIRFDGAAAAGTGLAAWLDACTVPIALHDHARAGILGTATLLACGGRQFLLTAAHLFEHAPSSGNWLIPERASGHLRSLEGAQVRVMQGADMALIDLSRVPAWPRLLLGRNAIPVRMALRARAPSVSRRQRTATGLVTYCLAGYPAAWSRFERGYLAAKRLTITTLQRHEGAGEIRCMYGRTAWHHDGQVIHTPALDGMSGAAIWEMQRANGASTLRLAGVQSAFMHSHYLRGDRATLYEPVFHW